MRIRFSRASAYSSASLVSLVSPTIAARRSRTRPEAKPGSAAESRKPAVTRKLSAEELNGGAVHGPFYPARRRVSDVPQGPQLARPSSVVCLSRGVGGGPRWVAIDDHPLPREFKVTVVAELVPKSTVGSDKRMQRLLSRHASGPVIIRPPPVGCVVSGPDDAVVEVVVACLFEVVARKMGEGSGRASRKQLGKAHVTSPRTRPHSIPGLKGNQDIPLERCRVRRDSGDGAERRAPVSRTLLQLS